MKTVIHKLNDGSHIKVTITKGCVPRYTHCFGESVEGKWSVPLRARYAVRTIATSKAN